ncbi:MAG: phosphoglycerate kinase [bacterium]|nr:phosphoglycerate kinase [bacterium]
MKTIKSIKNLEGKKVLVRVDFNVPINNGEIIDDSRIIASLHTIDYLSSAGAKVILVAHLGRPDGKVVPTLKLDTVASRVGKLLKMKVKKLETKDFKLTPAQLQKLRDEINEMKNGQVVMLENIRFSPYEKKNTSTLAMDLASLADIFVLDGFAVAHRASASVTGVVKYLPSYAGFLLEQEIHGLQKVLKRPRKPFVAIIGGIKVSTKAPVIKNLLPKVSNILIGGGILNTYLKCRGYGVGMSLVDPKCEYNLEKLAKKRKVILPVDLIVGDNKGRNFRIVQLGKKPHKVCTGHEAIYDIGPASICLFSGFIKKAQTIVWNGAVGYFEQKPYNIGTLSIARLVASRSKGRAYGVVGGGETLQAMEEVKMSQYIDLISTGGGAMLEFLSGKKLPGIEVLKH